MTQLLNVMRQGKRIAWTSLWLVDEMDEHRLVAIPRLRLSQETTLELTARIPYTTVFENATIQVLNDPPRTFFVVHATFDLYRTGEPDISGFAAIVPAPGVPLPDLSLVISRTAKMLRGEMLWTRSNLGKDSMH
jgi:hypothetical protein